MTKNWTKNGYRDGNDAVGWKVQEGLDRLWESLEGMTEINHKGSKIVEIMTQGQTLNLQL
jgi:hypothetical protein